MVIELMKQLRKAIIKAEKGCKPILIVEHNDGRVATATEASLGIYETHNEEVLQISFEPGEVQSISWDDIIDIRPMDNEAAIATIRRLMAFLDEKSLEAKEFCDSMAGFHSVLFKKR